MKVAYLDCFSGISGDMLLGAVVDAGVPLEAIEGPLRTLPLKGWRMRSEKVTRGGIAATQVRVELDGAEHHPHRGLSEVLELIGAGELPPPVVERSTAVFRALAEAEARVHGTTPEQVHFHEVGAVDAICDIVGAVLGLEALGVERVWFSKVHLGGGTVRAAHGELPVPAPATAELLKGLPCEGGPLEAELTTPTGAALLKALGEPRPAWPAMSVERIGYGAGARQFEHWPNVLRLAVGQCPPETGAEGQCIWVLETNVDDMTAEEVGFCLERLLEAGALDVFTTPVQMKKNRPGVLLSVLCAPQSLEAVETALWLHTSTLGVRRSLWERSVLQRRTVEVNTPWGPVRVKVADRQGRTLRVAPEYEDCAAIARRHGLPLRQVYRAALEAAAWVTD